MKKILAGGIFASIILMGGGVSNAQDESHSTRVWRGEFKKVESAKEAEDLPKGSQIAMACSKCKSMTMIVKKELGTKPGHGMTEEAVSVDKCPGCGGKITTKSSGKETTYTHTCSVCGDDSAFCCASKPGDKTRGMDK